MKHIKSYKRLFESINMENNQVSIDEFLRRIGINRDNDAIIQWWNDNRSNIKIHLFTFNSREPIAGVFLGSDTICVNDNTRMPPHIKLFLSLHESRHCDQHAENEFMSGYYDTVVNDDLQGFLRAYSELEKDANDFAINSMREIGFSGEMDREENMLRGNQRAGQMVFNMMKRDIERLNPTDFFDLLKKQIL